MREECGQDEKDSSSDCYICDIENREILETDKIRHRTKYGSLECIEESSCEYHEISRFLSLRESLPWFPEENTDTDEYERNEKRNPGEGSTKCYTCIFDMRDSENIFNYRKLRIRHIDPVFWEDISKYYRDNYKKNSTSHSSS